MNKVVNLVVGALGGAAIGTGIVEASQVTGIVAVVSQDAAVFASLFGAVFGGLVSLIKKTRTSTADTKPSGSQEEVKRLE